MHYFSIEFSLGGGGIEILCSAVQLFWRETRGNIILTTSENGSTVFENGKQGGCGGSLDGLAPLDGGHDPAEGARIRLINLRKR